MRKIIFILLLLVPVILDAQIITTIAGTGSSVYSGNGVLATSAGIPNPRGSAFDKHGNYYFTDGSGSHRVRKIDIAGIITTVAGNGLGGYSGDGGIATSAKLYYPIAVAFDTIGNIYIADLMNYRIRKVDVITGNISTYAGNGTSTYTGNGVSATVAGLTGPDDICFDKLGNLYISDNYWIRKVTPAGIIFTIAGNGTAGSSGDGGPATNAQIYGSFAVACDTNGNVYIAERTGNRVRKVDTFGIITTFAGNGSPTYLGDGIPATNAQIVPNKMGFDSLMQLYIADDYNERIFMVDASGILHNIAGNGTIGFSGDGGPATAAALQLPAGIAFDACGNLFFPDAFNRRIRKVTLNPTCNPSLESEQIKSLIEIPIYPNPTSSLLHIENIKPKTTYQLLSIVGAVMQSGNLKEGGNTIPMQHLAPGMYLLHVTNEAGERVVRRVVRE